MIFRYSEKQYKQYVTIGFVLVGAGLVIFILFSLNVFIRIPPLHYGLALLGLFSIFGGGTPHIIRGYKYRSIGYELDHAGFKIVHPTGIKTTIRWQDIKGVEEKARSIIFMTPRGQEEIYRNLTDFEDFYVLFMRFAKRQAPGKGKSPESPAPSPLSPSKKTLPGKVEARQQGVEKSTIEEPPHPEKKLEKTEPKKESTPEKNDYLLDEIFPTSKSTPLSAPAVRPPAPARPGRELKSPSPPAHPGAAAGAAMTPQADTAQKPDNRNQPADPLPMKTDRNTRPIPQQPGAKYDSGTRPVPQQPGANYDSGTRPVPQQPGANYDSGTRPVPQQPPANYYRGTRPVPQQPGANYVSGTRPVPQQPPVNYDRSTRPVPQQPQANYDRSTRPVPQQPQANYDRSTRPVPQQHGAEYDRSTRPIPQQPQANYDSATRPVTADTRPAGTPQKFDASDFLPSHMRSREEPSQKDLFSSTSRRHLQQKEKEHLGELLGKPPGYEALFESKTIDPATLTPRAPSTPEPRQAQTPPEPLQGAMRQEIRAQIPAAPPSSKGAARIPESKAQQPAAAPAAHPLSPAVHRVPAVKSPSPPLPPPGEIPTVELMLKRLLYNLRQI